MKLVKALRVFAGGPSSGFKRALTAPPPDLPVAQIMCYLVLQYQNYIKSMNLPGLGKVASPLSNNITIHGVRFIWTTYPTQKSLPTNNSQVIRFRNYLIRKGVDIKELERIWPNLMPRKIYLPDSVHNAYLWLKQYRKHADRKRMTGEEYVTLGIHLFHTLEKSQILNTFNIHGRDEFANVLARSTKAYVVLQLHDVKGLTHARELLVPFNKFKDLIVLGDGATGLRFVGKFPMQQLNFQIWFF